jgi:hypothetical protein
VPKVKNRPKKAKNRPKKAKNRPKRQKIAPKGKKIAQKGKKSPQKAKNRPIWSPCLRHLKDHFSADVDGVIQVRKQVRKEEGSHVAHEDLAELLTDVHGRAQLLVHLVDDGGQGHDARTEVSVGGLVDLGSNS